MKGGQLHVLAALPPRKSPQYPLEAVSTQIVMLYLNTQDKYQFQVVLSLLQWQQHPFRITGKLLFRDKTQACVFILLNALNR
jgi:hypothetical protein